MFKEYWLLNGLTFDLCNSLVFLYHNLVTEKTHQIINKIVSSDCWIHYHKLILSLIWQNLVTLVWPLSLDILNEGILVSLK